MATLQLPRLFATLQVPLLFLVNIVALAVPPKYQILRTGLSLPFVVVLVAQSWYKAPEGTFQDQYGLNCLVLTAAWIWVDWVLISTPDREKWRKIRYDRGGVDKRANGTTNGVLKQEYSETEEYPTSFLSRLWWATRLAFTGRYVGWTSQAKNTPIEVDASYPRVLFVARKSLRVLLFYMMRNALHHYSANTPYGGWVDAVPIKKRQSFFDAPFWTRFFIIWVDIVITYLSLEIINAANGVVQVAIGTANPRDCPSAYGDLKDLVTVRNLWAVVWHQQVRRFAGDPGIYLARDILGLQKGSFASKYLQLFVAFGISGWMHAGASMAIHRSLEDDAAMSFFLGQAVIIMIEDHVIDFGKRLGLRDSMLWRVVGFVWVVLISGISLQKWQGSVIDRGLWIRAREPDFFGIGPRI
ncbi:hypothetical protein ACN47E_007881 [Coniothyrium glycines]